MCVNVSLLILIFFSVITISVCSELDSHPSWKYLPTKDCGYEVHSDRIIGGKEAALGQYPWVVRLGYGSTQWRGGTSNIQYMCSGSLISRWYVLTANHCLESSMGKKLKHVRVGENNAGTEIDCENQVCAPAVQDIKVEYYIRSKNPDITYADIGLIRLKHPVRLNDYAHPICLPRGEILDNFHKFIKEGTQVYLAGWGVTDLKNYTPPDKLMFVSLPVSLLSACQNIFSNNRIDTSHLCVGIGKGKDTCVGDSGGPLMKPIALNGPPQYFLFGIVSYGVKRCGMKPAVYTNVTYYMKWILDRLENKLTITKI